MSITLVTGIWDIGRKDLSEGWSRPFSHYLDKFEQLLKVPENMIIFGDEELKKFVFERRNPENTQFIIRDLSWFRNNEFFDKIQKIRTNNIISFNVTNSNIVFLYTRGESFCCCLWRLKCYFASLTAFLY